MPRKTNCIVSFLRIIENITPDINMCKNWPMGISKTGYGVYSIDNITYSVHRLLFTTLNSEVDCDGFVIRHKCDNRSCCNIDHLEIGTQSENIMDASRRKRLLLGEKNNMSRLTESQVIEIRNSYPEKSTVDLAKIYGVAPGNIRDAITGRTWAYLPGAKPLNTSKRALGEKMGRSKLTNRQVLEIRSKYPNKKGPELAKEYRVGHAMIYNIIKRKNWNHI